MKLERLDFLDEVIAEREAREPGFRARVEALTETRLAAARRVPPLVLCTLCGDPLELRARVKEGEVELRPGDQLVCGCSRSPSTRRDQALNSKAEEAPILTRDELVLLGERYGVADGRPKTVAEVARARGTTRRKVRELEGRALRTWRAIIRSGT